MRQRFLAGIASLVIVCIGCGKSKFEIAHDLAVKELRDSVFGQAQVAQDDDISEHDRLRAEFIMSSEQAALVFLERVGPQAMETPIVLWNNIFPAYPDNPEDHPDKQNFSYSHGIQLMWLEVEARVTGFYFVMKDGTTQEFSKVFDPDDEYITGRVRSGPGRYELVAFTHTQDIPAKGIFLHWPIGLFEQVITKQSVQGVGLILEDDSKTRAGPVHYQRTEKETLKAPAKP